MCIVVIGGMDRLAPHYREEAKRLGITLRAVYPARLPALPAPVRYQRGHAAGRKPQNRRPGQNLMAHLTRKAIWIYAQKSAT